MSRVEVCLVGDSRAFLADEVEYMPSGWLRAVGVWPRWDLDDEADEIAITYSSRREYTWPPHRIKEVRG